jgi:hypothetical protein
MLAASAFAQIGLPPNSTGTSLDAVTQTGRGTCFRLTRDEHSRPATAFAVSVTTTGSPTAYTVLFEGTEIGTGADAVTLGTITEATDQTIYVSNVFPKTVCANLTALSGGTSPKVTAKISPVANTSAMPGVSPDGKGGMIVSGQLALGKEYDNGTCTTAATIDPANGNMQYITLTAGQTCSLTFLQPTSGTVSLSLAIFQSVTSPYNGAITSTTAKWPGGTVPTITVGSGGTGDSATFDKIVCHLGTQGCTTKACCVPSQDFR